MKKILALLCVCLAVCIAASAFNPMARANKPTAKTSATMQKAVNLEKANLARPTDQKSRFNIKKAPARVSSIDELCGTRIWNYVCVDIADDSLDENGDTVYYLVQQNPYYNGHSIDIQAGTGDSVEIYFYVFGNTEYSVAGKVDLNAGTISIPNMQRVDYEATADTTTDGTGTRATTTITNTYYDLYFYNADDGKSDITLTILDDGSLYFENWFAVVGYIKQDVTKTSNGRTNTTEGEWQGMYVFNGYYYGTSAYILVPNGIHKMTSHYYGDIEAPIYMSLSETNDSVFIVNLFDWGMRGNYMTYEQTEGGAMTFPCQMIYDYNSATYGDNIYNYTADAELTTIEGYGNEGLAYQDSLVWNYCLAYSDTGYVFDFTTYNKIYFTDGTKFFEVAADHDYDLGDVNHDGSVDITDVTALIDRVLAGQETPDTCCDICGDINGDNIIDITDVTGLIDLVLSGGK